jgi:hypothetical protein
MPHSHLLLTPVLSISCIAVQVAHGNWLAVSCAQLQHAANRVARQLVDEYKESAAYQQRLQGQLGRDVDLELHWEMIQRVKHVV